jgi:hypothetical protein
LDLHWPEDRGPASTWFARLSVDVVADGDVHISLTDSRGEVATARGSTLEVGTVAGPPPPGAPLLGLSRLTVTPVASGMVRQVTVSYARSRPQGLLCGYGVRSNHPLDGKAPGRGAPTHYWSGTVWAPYVFHAVAAMRAYGEPELADLVAEAFVAGVRQAYLEGVVAPEHLCDLTGTGLGASRQAWTAAVALLLDPGSQGVT